MQENQTLKDYALSYADLDLAVFPLKPRDKRPATQNGCKAATTNKEQIAEWWDNYPECNIGIATGQISGGLIVIDQDVDNDKGINGYETLKQWQKEHGELPDTWQSITGRGGYHLFYRDSSTAQNRVGLYEGIDIRGDGGYIVAPPSIHPNGRRYEWEQEPGSYPLSEATSLVSDFLNPVPERWGQKSFEMPTEIPEGQRTDYMVKMVCSMQAKGASDEAIKAAVKAENEAKCNPPLTDSELIKQVFPALQRYEKGTSPYIVTYENGKFKPLKGKPTLSTISLDGIEAQSVDWLWYPYLPKGKVTIMLADPGVGKTTMTLYFSAIVSRGGLFPYETDNPFETRLSGNVIIQNSEDGLADTIVPRLLKMNPNMSNIHVIDETEFALTFKDDRIEEAFEKLKPTLAIFDPMQSYIGSDTDMHRANELRPVLNKLVKLADKYGTAIIIVAHMNKQSMAPVLERILGSADIRAIARSILVLVNDAENKDNKVMTHEKSSLARHGDGLKFHIDYRNNGIVCDGTTTQSADEILAIRAKRARATPVLDDAKDLLEELVKEHGYVKVKDAKEEASKLGIGYKTLQNARKEIGLKYKKYGFGKAGTEWWVVGENEISEEDKKDEAS